MRSLKKVHQVLSRMGSFSEMLELSSPMSVVAELFCRRRETKMNKLSVMQSTYVKDKLGI